MRKIIYLTQEKFEKKWKDVISKFSGINASPLVDAKLADKGIQNFATRDVIYAVK